MKNIVVFGAGKSASCLITYLIAECGRNGWQLTVADGDGALARAKTGDAPNTHAVELNVENSTQRSALIQQADIVISLLPPVLHRLVAQDCVETGRNLLTASYVDEEMRGLKKAVTEKKLLFLCEMGLDPGIDHMSAMKLIHEIQATGGHINSFASHCGGLVAPESDNNLWHYKISWNPRNIVMAGKGGAVYKENDQVKQLPYEALFDAHRTVAVPGLGQLAYYPNRDSLSYISLYNLPAAATFIRTTLRHPDFCLGWKHVIDLQLTNETKQYETEGLSLQQFYRQHVKQHALEGIAGHLPANNLLTQQLNHLGWNDDTTLINKGLCSAADVLQLAIEKKLALAPEDKDMIVMLHEIAYEKKGHQHLHTSCLIVKGENNVHTAMAKTVGLPLGIAAKLILEGVIKETGLHIPVIPAIYEPVLAELHRNDIIFHEAHLAIP